MSFQQVGRLSPESDLEPKSRVPLDHFSWCPDRCVNLTIEEMNLESYKRLQQHHNVI